MMPPFARVAVLPSFKFLARFKVPLFNVIVLEIEKNELYKQVVEEFCNEKPFSNAANPRISLSESAAKKLVSAWRDGAVLDPTTVDNISDEYINKNSTPSVVSFIISL